jgi:PAS domain S-box-containing protein
LRLVTWQPAQHSLATRLLVALLITAFAAWIRVALAPAESGGRFITLSLAAAVAALYGGFWVGMFSTLVGMLFVNFLLVKPYFSLAFDNPLEAFWLNTWHLLTQLVVVGAISFMQGQNRRLRQATDEVRLRAKQLEDTFEHSSTGMAHSHIDGRWIRVNQTYCDLVGYTRSEIQSLSFRDFTHPDDLALDVEQLERTLRGEIANYSVEKRYLHKQGQVIWVHLTVSLVRTEDGQPDYLIAVVQDITARKATELARPAIWCA